MILIVKVKVSRKILIIKHKCTVPIPYVYSDMG